MKKTVLVIILTSFLIGSLTALFLALLQAAIQLRFKHSWLLYLLPLAGLCIHWLYQWAGSASEKGNNLILEEIQQPGAGVPGRMGPLILLTTIITHLFGGSAGREGTAVQMGGSTAALLGKWFNLQQQELSLLLTCGIAAGFGAVFGTPFTGAIFACEVLTLGRIRYQALLPGLLASVLADLTVRSWGIHHHVYSVDAGINQTGLLLFKVILASVAFGLTSLFFIRLTHGLKATFNYLFPVRWLMPLCGGILIIALTLLLGKPDYLSLGVDAAYPGAVTIPGAFQSQGAEPFSWFWKALFTAITLSTGFKGGEVTPLFYIGATLGNTLSALLNAPVSLFAALGFIAVFAGATNTPLACTIMGMELFGLSYGLLFAVACFTAYLCSGRQGIYVVAGHAVPLRAAQAPAAIQACIHYFDIKLDKYRLKFSPKRKSK